MPEQDLPSTPLPADERPVDHTPVHTADLPATPLRDRNIPATAWAEAPPGLLDHGEDLRDTVAMYKRRIGRWLLWRAGPARKAHARYVAVDADDVDRLVEFRLRPDGSGGGAGPTGTRHERFRTWKEDLRDH
jgi:hypothetical protein